MFSSLFKKKPKKIVVREDGTILINIARVPTANSEMYDLKEMTDPERKPDTLYIKHTTKGLAYDVVMDGMLKSGLLAWDKLSEFPQDAKAIADARNRSLPKLLALTSENKHTPLEPVDYFIKKVHNLLSYLDIPEMTGEEFHTAFYHGKMKDPLLYSWIYVSAAEAKSLDVFLKKLPAYETYSKYPHKKEIIHILEGHAIHQPCPADYERYKNNCNEFVTHVRKYNQTSHLLTARNTCYWTIDALKNGTLTVANPEKYVLQLQELINKIEGKKELNDQYVPPTDLVAKTLEEKKDSSTSRLKI